MDLTKTIMLKHKLKKGLLNLMIVHFYNLGKPLI